MTAEQVSARAVTAGLVAATAAWNVLQNRMLPRWTYVPANLVGSGAALGVARRLGLDSAALGISRRRAGAGLRTGVAVAAPLVAALVAAERSPRVRRFFGDERAAVAPRTLVYETAVRIPLGTALFEETLFRGLLLSWFRSRAPEGRAIAWSSAMFGLWHVLPTWETMPGYAGGALRSRPVSSAAALVSAVVGTGLAGVGFSALRLRSGSLLAPIVVHAAVNAAALTVAWRVVELPDVPAAGRCVEFSG